MDYHIVQNFDGGNIGGFDALLATCQNFSFFNIFNCIANTSCLRAIDQYFPHQTSE